MSYEARINEDDTWRVCDFEKHITAAYNVHGRSQAMLFAWALNIIATGGRLEGFVPTSKYMAVDSSGADARVFACHEYNGPTEGIQVTG